MPRTERKKTQPYPDHMRLQPMFLFQFQEIREKWNESVDHRNSSNETVVW